MIRWLRRRRLMRLPVYGPYEPPDVYEAYYTWYLAQRWWTLEDFQRYLLSGRAVW